MKVLAIGAHFDDCELGCGGTLAAHRAKGDDVTIYTVTRSGFSNVAQEELRSSDIALSEGEEAAKRLDCQLICGEFDTFHVGFDDALNSALFEVIEAQKPDIIYTHWLHDIHHDHSIVAQATLHTSRHVPRLLMYRSNWYPTTVAFEGNFYSDITNFWETKVHAIHAHQSEFDRGVGKKWLEFFQNEARNAGQRIGVQYAEVFQVVKWLAT